MTYICPCKYPLVILDTRDGSIVEYIALPTELVKGGDMPVPSIDIVDTEGVDGVKRKYAAVQWQELNHTNVKEYEVSGHTVIVGCESSAVSMQDGEMKCDSKSMYIVLHPFDEWVDNHFVQLPQSKTK